MKMKTEFEAKFFIVFSLAIYLAMSAAALYAWREGNQIGAAVGLVVAIAFAYNAVFEARWLRAKRVADELNGPGGFCFHPVLAGEKSIVIKFFESRYSSVVFWAGMALVATLTDLLVIAPGEESYWRIFRAIGEMTGLMVSVISAGEMFRVIINEWLPFAMVGGAFYAGYELFKNKPDNAKD